jgi:hypothetical protein
MRQSRFKADAPKSEEHITVFGFVIDLAHDKNPFVRLQFYADQLKDMIFVMCGMFGLCIIYAVLWCRWVLKHRHGFTVSYKTQGKCVAWFILILWFQAWAVYVISWLMWRNFLIVVPNDLYCIEDTLWIDIIYFLIPVFLGLWRGASAYHKIYEQARCKTRSATTGGKSGADDAERGDEPKPLITITSNELAYKIQDQEVEHLTNSETEVNVQNHATAVSSPNEPDQNSSPASMATQGDGILEMEFKITTQSSQHLTVGTSLSVLGKIETGDDETAASPQIEHREGTSPTMPTQFSSTSMEPKSEPQRSVPSVQGVTDIRVPSEEQNIEETDHVAWLSQELDVRLKSK